MLVLFDGDLGVRDTFRFVEEQLGIGITSYDLASGNLDWSLGVYKLLELEPDLIKPSFEKFQSKLHPDDRLPQERLEQLLREGANVVRDCRVLQKNRTIRWIRIRSLALFDAAGDPTKLTSIIVDVTGHYDEVLPLKTHKGRFHALVGAVQAVNAVVWTASAGGSITGVHNWKRTEDGSASVFDDGWLDFVHRDDRQETQDRWSAALKTGQTYCVDHRVLQPDDEYRWVRSQAVPVLKGRAVQEWVGISVDVNDMTLSDFSSSSQPTLTGSQMRAARGILKWSVKQLADRVLVSPAVIRRLEESDGTPAAPGDLMEFIQKTFSDTGIEFLFARSGKPGLRPRQRRTR